MSKKYYFGGLIATVCAFVIMAPAQAFYIEIPQILKDAIQSLKSSVRAQEAGELQPAPPSVVPDEPVLQPIQIEQPIDKPAPEQPVSSDAVQPPANNPPMNFQPQPMQSGQPNQPGPNNQQMLKDLKRGASDVTRQLKQFETLITKFEKKGVVVSADIKTKIEELRALITKFQSITSVEEAQDLSMDDLYSKMRDLEEERRNLEQMDNILREMKRIESSIKTFEKQVAKLAKQKMAVPMEITDNLAKVKAVIVEIKAGNMANAEDIFELVQNLDENRGQMEMLARWPQTLKEMDRQMRSLNTELKRAKTTTARLAKKDIDVSSIYTQFESAIAKLKETRDAAKSKIQENAEDAFDLAQNDFFGQMDDVMESQRIIMTMGNFGQFQTDFTRQTNQAAQQIKALKKKKIDVADLEDLLAQAKAKGAEVKVLFKAKPLDVDVVIEALNEVENLGQEFDQKVSELTGVEADMPWEKGPQQFQQIQVSPNLDKWIPKQAQPTVSGSTGNGGGQTCNVNGVELPGAC